MKSLKIYFWAVLSLGLSMTMSCTESSDPDPEPEEKSSEILLSNHATYGSIITDGDGITLYFFAKDANGESACLEGCLSKWPIFYVETPELASGLSVADFSTITHPNGEKQTTYKGWPLYYYAPAGDGEVEAAGETAGENVGGVWFVAKPDYTVMLVTTQLTGNDGVNYKSDYTAGDGTTTYLVDDYGNTLYGWIKDYNGINKFTKEDFSNNASWPIYETELGAVPSALSSGDFATIDVHGKMQLTYKGWPLYHFGQDASRGQNKGVSVPSPGVWPVVNQSSETAPTAPNINLYNHSTLGEVIVDGQGRILYFFTKDVAGTSACSGGCLNSWPIFYESNIILPNNGKLESEDFGVITRGDGAMQSTYKGWPLYYYSSTADGVIEAAGDALGEGKGTVWYVAKENYDLMIADAQLVGKDGKNYLSDYTEGTGLTKFFTDQEGRTLYIYIRDTKDTNNFTNSDFSNNAVWPIFYTDVKVVPSGMSLADFGEIDVFGQKQLTFKGWPVYYYGSDAIRGETKGVSVPSPGFWPIINNNTVAAQ